MVTPGASGKRRTASRGQVAPSSARSPQGCFELAPGRTFLDDAAGESGHAHGQCNAHQGKVSFASSVLKKGARRFVPLGPVGWFPRGGDGPFRKSAGFPGRPTSGEADAVWKLAM